MNDLYIVIMAGGSGVRFWPLSTPAKPKQCLRLFSSRSLLSECVLRALQLVPFPNLLVVTGKAMMDSVRDELPMLPAENIIVEPSPRNTAPCIALALHHIRKKGGKELMIWPCDHFIASSEEWIQASRTARERAQRETLVLVGIKPTHPATSYGYIEAAETWQEQSCHEKPTRARAASYIRRGFLWNAGVCVAQVSSIVALFHAHLPRCAAFIEDGLLSSWDTLERTSFDYGVLEKAAGLGVVSYSKGWSDLGSWDAVHSFLPKDENGHSYHGNGELISIESDACTVFDSEERAVALVGVSNLVVVSAKNGLLVINRSDAQRVREIVEALNKS